MRSESMESLKIYHYVNTHIQTFILTSDPPPLFFLGTVYYYIRLQNISKT